MNPRAALTTYSLSRGAPSASLGTSPNCPTILSALVSTYLPFESFVIISHCFCFVKHFFQVFLFYFFLLGKRREWDSNPRALADKRFSRPPRYDHFDISPYVVDCVRCVLTADASDILASIPASVNNFFTFFSIFIFIFPDFP